MGVLEMRIIRTSHSTLFFTHFKDPLEMLRLHLHVPLVHYRTFTTLVKFKYHFLLPFHHHSRRFHHTMSSHIPSLISLPTELSLDNSVAPSPYT